MKKRQQLASLLLSVMMLLSLCACGSYRSVSKASAPTPAPAAGSYNSSFSYDGAVEEAASMAMADYEADYGFSAVASSAAVSGGAVKNETGSDTTSENPDKIIYSSDVTLETTKFDETIGKIGGLVDEFGGWIESSSVSGSNYYQKSRGTASTRDASYTLRIPSARFRELMDSLSDLGNIPYSHVYTENVTAQYYDTEAHLKAYKTQETRLLEMMELAESVEDVIIIEDRLTELRYKIESLQSSLNNWDRRVSYSTIFLTVKEVREYTPEEKDDPSYGEELLEALKDGLYNAGQFLKDLLVLIVEVLPVLLLLIPIVWLIVWLIRKLLRRYLTARAARKEARRLSKLAAQKTAPAPQAVETVQKKIEDGK